MRIFVKVKPAAKTEKIEKIAENSYFVFVKEPARNGKANEALIRKLAKYFDIAKSRIQIVSGEKSKRKILEIL